MTALPASLTRSVSNNRLLSLTFLGTAAGRCCRESVQAQMNCNAAHFMADRSRSDVQEKLHMSLCPANNILTAVRACRFLTAPTCSTSPSFFISKKHENKNCSVECCVSVGAPQPLLNTDFLVDDTPKRRRIQKSQGILSTPK